MYRLKNLWFHNLPFPKFLISQFTLSQFTVSHFPRFVTLALCNALRKSSVLRLELVISLNELEISLFLLVISQIELTITLNSLELEIFLNQFIISQIEFVISLILLEISLIQCWYHKLNFRYISNSICDITNSIWISDSTKWIRDISNSTIYVLKSQWQEDPCNISAALRFVGATR